MYIFKCVSFALFMKYNTFQVKESQDLFQAISSTKDLQ